MSAVRVGVNLCWVGADAAPDAVNAVVSTLEAVAASPPDDLELVLFGSRWLRERHPALVEAFETHTMPVPASLRALRVGAEYTWLPAAVSHHDIDVLHDAGGTSAGTIHLPRVLTVDDLLPLEQPRGVNPLRVAHHRRVVPRAVDAATSVVVPSEFVRSRLVDHLGADPSKIQVVPWPLPPHSPAMPIETVRARYGIIGKILLLPATTNAHEEHVVAVRAMQHLAARHKETTLVLAGDEGPTEGRVLREVVDLGLEDRVVRIGPVPPPVVAALFDHASAVVYPAVYGGFPSAVLEAMASAVPVVVADEGAAPELVDGAGAVVPSGDHVQLAIELHRVLDDPEWRRRMVDAGLDRARAHTAERSAHGLVAAYRSVLVDL